VQSTVLCGVFQHAPDSAAKRFETIRVFVQEALQLSIAVDVCDASVRVWGLLPATPTCCMLMPWQQSAQVHAVLTVQGGRIVTAFLATSGRGRRYLREYLLQVLTCMYVCVHVTILPKNKPSCQPRSQPATTSERHINIAGKGCVTAAPGSHQAVIRSAGGSLP